MKTVIPKYFEGVNISIAQLFGSGPKWTITCGNCEMTFKRRIPMIEEPGILCPHCNAINKLRYIPSPAYYRYALNHPLMTRNE